MTEKDKELMDTKGQIQKQLGKIVHRTWYIFDPEKKAKAKDTYKTPKNAKKSPSINGNTTGNE